MMPTRTAESLNPDGPAFQVPLVPQGLSRQEAIQQLGDALEILDRVSKDIFSRWVRSCYLKPRRRPNSGRVRDEASAIRSTLPGEGAIRRMQRNRLVEKLQFFHVTTGGSKQNDYEEAEEGLGALPKNLTSVGSLLLFNTLENPYKKYVMLDPLGGAVTRTRKALQEGQGKGPAAPPISIGQQEQMGNSYFYVPDLGEVPELDVPTYLPDLPGVADDLACTLDLGPGIAPSLLTATLPELPTFGNDAHPDPQHIKHFKKCVCGNAGALPSEVACPSNDRASLLESIRQAGGVGGAKLRNLSDRKLEKKKQKEQLSGEEEVFLSLSPRLPTTGSGVSTGGGGGAQEGPGGALARMVNSLPALPARPGGEAEDGGEDEWGE
uniref:WAS protein family homolog 1 n=1 Tax=Eptatretus burgeri TaxID=7764 RepID=A0A8C4R8U4_EPTBU